MKRLKSLVVFCILLLSCSSDEDMNERNFELNGLNYQIKSYLINHKVDLNEDGIFSNDLVKEKNCFGSLLFDAEEMRISNPLNQSIMAHVVLDDEGNPQQNVSCGIGEGFRLGFELDGDTVKFISVFLDEVRFTGTLSENKKRITITYPKELLFRESFVFEDGTYGEYDREVTAVYELVE